MDLESIRGKKFTEEDLQEIRKTKEVKFKSFNSRVSINVYMVYEKKGDHPAVIEYRKAFPVTNSLDMYKRTLEIDKGQKIALEFQWLEGKAGIIYIANVTGQDMPTRPTELMKKQIAESEATIHVGNSELPIFPGKLPLVIPAPRVGKVAISAPLHSVSVHLCVLPD